MKTSLLSTVAALLALLLGLPSTSAQALPDIIKIGLLGDESGPYADVGGPGSVAAARMAVADFGGTVLGRPIEIVVADSQNNPDVGASIARRWFDAEGVLAIADGAPSSVGLAIQSLARERKKLFFATGSVTSDLTNAACSPFGFHFVTDTYSVSVNTARTLTEQGAKKWFMVVADYNFGYAIARDATDAIAKAGGTVVGETKVPLNTPDFSSYLLQAQASGAQAIGMAVAGSDLVNAIKQAHEFGLTHGGKQQLAALQLAISDVEAIGLEEAQGLISVVPFYWDLNEATRAWTARFRAARDQTPTRLHAATYSAVLHYLEAVRAAGTVDGDTVAEQVRTLPLDDVLFRGGHVRADGRAIMDFYEFQVKSPEESRYPHDDYRILSRIPGDQVFRPTSESQCPLLKAR